MCRRIRAVNRPTATKAGNPGFRVWNGAGRIIGYIEAKRPSEERLDAIEDSEQRQRYRATFPNLILTNFLEFRLYRNGACIESVLAGRPMPFMRSLVQVERSQALPAAGVGVAHDEGGHAMLAHDAPGGAE